MEESNLTSSRTMSEVVGRALRKRLSTEVVPAVEYYPEDTGIDIDAEINRLSGLEKTSENIHRIENLKRLKTLRKWDGKWFLNDAREDCKQYVKHTNWKFYWPWCEFTVIVDTVFLDVFPDGSTTVKIFQGHPFLIDHASSHYSEVTGKVTLNRIERWLKNPTETVSFTKMM